MKRDLDQALKFLNVMAGDNPVTYQTFGDKNKSFARIIQENGVDRTKVLHKLSQLNEKEVGIFWMVNQGDGEGRSNENVVGVRFVFIDLDENGGEKLKKVQENLSPHAVVESSRGKFHVYWKVENLPLGQFTSIQEGLSKKFGGDDIKDLARVLRVPGFLHQKGEPFLTRIVDLKTNLAPYSLDDIGKLISLKESKSSEEKSKSPKKDWETIFREGVGHGDRDQTVARLAGHYLQKGIGRDEILTLLTDFNSRSDPPLGTLAGDKTVEEVLDSVIKTAGRKKPEDGFPIEQALVNADDLLSLVIPPKRMILDPWLYEQQIILIPGWRGVGKTWFGLSLFDAVSRGERLGPWASVNSVPSLYIDGEMATYDIQERIRLLGENKSSRKSPFLIYNDAYANSLGLPRANLVNEKWRESLKVFLVEKGIKLLGLDNIASLTPGIEENYKIDWDPINQWLIELRFSGITTILFHHTGKDGNQRGTSGREDNIDTSISLVWPRDYQIEQGARFIVQFKKIRVYIEKPTLIADHEFHLIQGFPNLEWSYTTLKKKISDEVLRLISEGVKPKDIAERLNIVKSHVSQIKSRAVRDGYLSESGELTKKGKDHLAPIKEEDSGYECPF